METDLIKVKNSDLGRYEEVLLRRDTLKKQGEQSHVQYLARFGDIVEESFRMRVECIRKKKMIAYCQRLANQGKPISKNGLTAFIEREMAEYQEELDAIINDVKAVKERESVSAFDSRKIKEIYHALAKKIHPDLHPELAGDETLKTYWGRIVLAYTYNRLEDLEELQILVAKYLEENGLSDSDIQVENLEEKIRRVEKEIEQIISTNPYMYRFILQDEKECKQREQEYRDEIESYKNYAVQLDEVLGTFEIKEMLS